MANITATVELIATEDINFSTGGKTTSATFSRTTSTGGSATVHKVSAAAIPVEDTNSKWTATNIEDILEGLKAGSEALVDNNVSVYGRNAANSGNVAMIKVNASNKLEGGTFWTDSPSLLPTGSILAWVGGYFGDGSNGTYTQVLGSANTVAGANAYLNPLGFYVCNGAALNDAASPIFNGSGRYLPNLTDDRFIMGDTVVGGLGGESTNSHTHTVGTHTHTVADHQHPIRSVNVGAGSQAFVDFYDSTITGTVTGANTDYNTGVPSDTENRPLFLGCFYIMKVK